MQRDAVAVAAHGDPSTDSRSTFRRLTQNTRAINTDAPPTLHRAAPLAEILREEANGGEPPSQAERDLVADEHEIQAGDLHDFFPARRAPPPSGTWDVRLDGEALEREEAVVFEMLDEFDTAPPTTVQRLAELVLHPTYQSRSKYLAALQRVLSVSSTFGAYDGTAEEAEDTEGGAWPLASAAQADEEPIFSPIPFLHQGAEETARDDAPTQSEQSATPHGDAEAVYRVPDGRVDELDTADKQEAHGGVADKLEPLSAATSLPEPSGDEVQHKRARSDA